VIVYKAVVYGWLVKVISTGIFFPLPCIKYHFNNCSL